MYYTMKAHTLKQENNCRTIRYIQFVKNSLNRVYFNILYNGYAQLEIKFVCHFMCILFYVCLFGSGKLGNCFSPKVGYSCKLSDYYCSKFYFIVCLGNIDFIFFLLISTKLHKRLCENGVALKRNYNVHLISILSLSVHFSFFKLIS